MNRKQKQQRRHLTLLVKILHDLTIKPKSYVFSLIYSLKVHKSAKITQSESLIIWKAMLNKAQKDEEIMPIIVNDEDKKRKIMFRIKNQMVTYQMRIT